MLLIQRLGFKHLNTQYTQNQHQLHLVVPIHTYFIRIFLPFSEPGSLRSTGLPQTPSDSILQLADCDSPSQRITDKVFRIPCL